MAPVAKEHRLVVALQADVEAKSLGIGHGEVKVPTVPDPSAARAGLAPEEAPR